MSSVRTKPVLVIGGATASGKSSFALAWAKKEGGVIINGDSIQLYEGLPLLTAKPSREDQDAVPHYLYSTAQTVWNVMQWMQAVEKCLDDIGDQPVCIVGGTGFYLKCLIEGLCPIPFLSPEARTPFEQEYARKDLACLTDELTRRDPESARLLHDKRRIIYALMIVNLTGKTLSFWQKQARIGAIQYPVRRVLIWPSRTALKQKANARFNTMIDNGLWEEIAGFDAQKVLAPMRLALGLDACLAYVKGNVSFKACQEQYHQRVSRYIRRQQTWFRHQFSPHTVICPHAPVFS